MLWAVCNRRKQMKTHPHIHSSTSTATSWLRFAVEELPRVSSSLSAPVDAGIVEIIGVQLSHSVVPNHDCYRR